MANVKISALPASAGLVAADLIAVVDDPAGTPATQKATMTQVQDFIEASANVFTADQKLLAAAPTLQMQSSSATADKGLWNINANSASFSIYAANDAGVNGNLLLYAQRGVGSAISGIYFGQTGNVPVLFYGTMTAAAINCTKISVSSGTSPAGPGLYSAAPNVLSFWSAIEGGSFDAVGNFIHLKSIADQSKSVQTPTTGFSITISNNVSTLILTPAGTLATGTITMPAAPIDGQIIRVSSQQIQTALTVSPNAGQSILNPPTALAAGIGFGYIYHLATTTWLRLY